ncbi:N-acetylneuraminate synthase family protein [Nitrosopumilus ureiphilus]|uniref:Shikimate dehydrogenase n=1 Tax=Nitrosopumilus ureiphilus TaxID=1470067 RepID=A0A7D5M5I3_9ARCH|nr:N-acetylneuraminate synthase family protein [Nitrosopumilus ureiphilus]QLH07834.1 shikimate dehydrogenase [Nitrosopumilus ureiphilus]
MKTIIVAEIGSNWEGSVSKAGKIIHECKKAGADIVKFQMWHAKDLYSENHPDWKEIKKSELTFEKAEKIKKIADEANIEFMCSAFYPEGVKFLETLNVKRYKVASRTCLFKDPSSLETLESKAKSKKSIIISMGMGGNIKKIKKIFSKNKTTFCYCISDYPLKFNKIDWKKAVSFDGFSDHTLGNTAAILFTILKKQRQTKHILIEKHVKLENSKGPDASTSIDTKQLSELVSHIRILEKANF